MSGDPAPAGVRLSGVTETATAAAGSRRVDLSLEVLRAVVPPAPALLCSWQLQVSGAPADVDAWKAAAPCKGGSLKPSAREGVLVF